MEKKKVGDFFVEKGVLSQEGKKRVLEYSEQSGKSFGEAGLQLGLLSRDDMIKVFGPNFEIDFFYLDPRYFPKITSTALSKEEILRYGALPLGYKKKSGFLSQNKYLNIGFLNPANTAAVNQVREIVMQRLSGEHVCGVNIFLILSDQYLDVLRNVYSLSDDDIRKRGPQFYDETLQMHFS